MQHLLERDRVALAAPHVLELVRRKLRPADGHLVPVEHRAPVGKRVGPLRISVHVDEYALAELRVEERLVDRRVCRPVRLDVVHPDRQRAVLLDELRLVVHEVDQHEQHRLAAVGLLHPVGVGHLPGHGVDLRELALGRGPVRLGRDLLQRRHRRLRRLRGLRGLDLPLRRRERRARGDQRERDQQDNPSAHMKAFLPMYIQKPAL
ncbi:MAG: hypothetical protein BWY81_01199 [Firmicutes bacterium ADurb.Bin467]|nr:MAG: hypothetical protein BWY81_01199 [Firmicutes bacterium ADurb.Bin467]